MVIIRHLAGLISTPFRLILLAPLLTTLAIASDFSSIIFYIGSMTLDQGVSITRITDENIHVRLKGTSPDKLIVYQLAKKLFYSKSLRASGIKDVVPFWNNDGFTFILKKNEEVQNNSSFVTIESPAAREMIKEKIILKGTCSREGGDVIIAGDLEGKTSCGKGLWEISSQMTKFQHSVIGISVSLTMIDQTIVKDYRSFLVD